MTLNQLRTFIAVARCNGFTAASRVLKVSQTTITSQIQALEDEHGVRLFERQGRKIALTEVGYEFLQVARQMIALEDDAEVMLKDRASLRKGSLRIGAVSPFHVVEMIAGFTSDYPDVKLSMALGSSDDILKQLESYSCDIGILARDAKDDRYHAEHYASYPVIAFVNRNHPLARRGSVELPVLAGQKLLMREPGSTTRKVLEDAMAEAGLVPSVAMEIGSREAIREAVIRGLGVGVVSRSEYIPDERLHPLDIVGAEVVTHIYVCCLRERRRNMVISAFLDVVRRVSRQQG